MAMVGQGILGEDIVMSHFSTWQEDRPRAPGMVIALTSKLQGPVRKLATTDRQIGAPEMHFTFLAKLVRREIRSCGPTDALQTGRAGHCGVIKANVLPSAGTPGHRFF